MSRLIDADKIDFNEIFKGQSDFAKDTREAAQSLIDAQPTVEAVPVVQLESVLKEAYLEIANGYSVSDLQSDSDKVACVASKFRQTVLDKLRTSAE